MTTFDYDAAWHELARPAYEALPANVRDLLATTAVEAGDLRQLADCSMPWPSPEFRERFEKIPAEILCTAARAIYYLGHWYPGASANGYAVPGRDNGSTWKFAHYADQSLRARLNVAHRDNLTPDGVTLQIHEGVIRLCYSSRDMWTWEEVQPATAKGLARAQETAEALRQKLTTATGKHGRDNVAYAFFETLRAEPVNVDRWPSEYFAAFMDTAAYMRDESEIARRKVVTPVDWSAKLASLNTDIDGKIDPLPKATKAKARKAKP